MKVRMVFDFDNYCRLAINHHYGDNGLATRARIRTWINAVLDETLDDLIYDLERDEKEKP